MTVVESQPYESFEEPVIKLAPLRIGAATAALDTLSAQHAFGHDQYAVIEQAKGDLQSSADEFERTGNRVGSLRARTALAFADLTARRGEFIARRAEHRLPSSFRELFIDRTYVAAGMIALEGLEQYQSELNEGRKAELKGFLNEMAGLMVSLAGDTNRFAVPSSVYDDRFNSGFRFDMMMYDLNRPRDIRRAVDMKSSAPRAGLRVSRFARQVSANDLLHNATGDTFWEQDELAGPMEFPTLQAAIGNTMVEPDHVVRQKLAQIHEEFFAATFSHDS